MNHWIKRACHGVLYRVLGLVNPLAAATVDDFADDAKEIA